MSPPRKEPSRTTFRWTLSNGAGKGQLVAHEHHCYRSTTEWKGGKIFLSIIIHLHNRPRQLDPGLGSALTSRRPYWIRGQLAPAFLNSFVRSTVGISPRNRIMVDKTFSYNIFCRVVLLTASPSPTSSWLYAAPAINQTLIFPSTCLNNNTDRQSIKCARFHSLFSILIK